MLLSLFGCDPEGPGLPFVRLVSEANPTDRREYALLVDENVGAGDAELGAVAGDIGFVDYDIRDNHRLFLFAGNLEEGIVSGEYLQLPATLLPRQDSNVALDDPSKWRSFRSYDVGVYSELIPWQFFTIGLVQSFEDGFRENARITGGSIRRSALTPIIQARRRSDALRNDADGLRVELEFHASTIELEILDATCQDVSIMVDMTLRFASDDDILVPLAPGGFETPTPDWPQECPSVGDPGATRMIFDTFTRDVFATVEEIGVTATGCGVANEKVAGHFRNALRESIPSKLRIGFRDYLLKDPRALGVPEDEIRGCQCDSQCDFFSAAGPAYVGKRHVCRILEPNVPCETDMDCDRFYHEEPGEPGYSCRGAGDERRCVPDFFPILRGECWVQLEPDRINVRPDGIEFVTIGTNDPQANVALNDRNGDGQWDGVYSRRTCDPPDRSDPLRRDYSRGNYLLPTGSPRLGVFDPPFTGL